MTDSTGKTVAVYANSLNVRDLEIDAENQSTRTLEKAHEDREAPAEEYAPSTAALSRLETVLLMSALSLANFLVALDTTIATTALPVITAHFQSSAGYAWIGSAYILATAVTTPVWAKLSDIWGRKPLLLLSITLFFLGSLLCGVSVTMNMLILSRAVQGLGGGGLSILVTICISDAFSMRERPVYFGIIGMTWAFASAIGPLLGGILASKASWRWCFFINLPCTGICLFIVIFKLKVFTPKTPMWDGLKAVDWLGSIIMISGAAIFLLGLQMGGVEYPWSSPIIICLIIFGVLLSVIFIIVEWKVAKYPLMPLRTFKRSNLPAFGVGCIHSMVVTGGSYFLPLYFQGVLGASPLLSGVYLIPLALSLSVVNCIMGFVVRQTGKYLQVMRISTLIMALGFGLFIDLPANYNWAKLIIYQLLAGIGIGPNFQCPLIALQAATPQADHAAASSTFNFLRNLSASIAIVVSTSIFQNEMQSQHDSLVVRLGADVADLLTGANAAANVDTISNLPPDTREFAQRSFLKAMLGIWILFTALAAGSFFCSIFARDKVLSTDHTLTETGLRAEESKRVLEKESRGL